MNSSYGIPSLVFFFFVSCTWRVSESHVGLTFPPARHFDLDFLDNIRTKPPCGMPKGKTKTLLQSGIPLNISWHLSYPHRGGYRLELLDRNEKFLLDLISRSTNSTNEYKTGDPTAQWHTVTIPEDIRCDDCSIRLLRQASEWANSYRFWSCADVRIVGRDDFSEDCTGHGSPVNGGGCRCIKGFWGPRCQYEEECLSDVDCGKGSCIDLGGTALPQRQCFCPPGLHGERCSKKNLVELPTKASLDLSSYKKEELSKGVRLFHKVVEDDKEVEFVLEVDGTSYGAIGWRPSSFNKSCKLWPHLDDTAVIKRGKREAMNRKREYIPNETLLRPVDQERSSNKASSSGERKSSISTIKSNQGNLVSRNRPPKRQSLPEPTAEVEAEAEAEPPSKSQAEPEPQAEANHHQNSHPSKSQAEPESEPKPETSPEPEAESEAEPPTSEPKPEAESEPINKPEPIAEAESTKAEPESEPATAESEPPGASHSSQSYVPKSEPEVQAESETKPETESEPKPEAESEPKPEAESEPKPEAESEPKPESLPEESNKLNSFRTSGGDSSPNRFTWETRSSPYAPKGDFHAMDCTDIVLGSARGVYSRILDYYSRDRSTPRLDSFWGGSNDISSATGWESNGKTTLIFRKPLISSSPTDHSLTSGLMHVIWAVGQRAGAYVHSPASGLEKESPSVGAFYAEDEIKYHGHRDQRGVTFIDFT